MSAPPTTSRGEQTVIQTIAGQRTASRASSAPKFVRPTVTMAVVQDPTRLQRHLADLQRQLDDVFAIAQSSAIGGGVLIRNISMPKNTMILVDHRLGRATQGWFTTRIVGSAGIHPTVAEVPLPSTRSSSQWLQLESSGDCTVDVYVF